MKQSDYDERLKNTGRNDPCPCGSGKKYKKCHLLKDEKALRKERLEQEVDNTEQAQEETKQESNQDKKNINKVAPKARLSKKQRLSHN